MQSDANADQKQSRRAVISSSEISSPIDIDRRCGPRLRPKSARMSRQTESAQLLCDG
jgi:hypothetical protein